MTNSTNVGRERLRARRMLLAITTVLCSGLATPAFAQLSPHPNPDANGVDLTDGTFNLQLQIAATGSGDTALPLIITSGGVLDNWGNISLIKTSASGGGFNYLISLGAKADAFTGTGTTLQSKYGTGAVLEVGVDSAIYRLPDGTEIAFSNPAGESGGTSNLCDANNLNNCTLLPESIRPKGDALVYFDWTTRGNCDGPLGEANCTYSWRLADVRNDAGYRISWTYASSTVPIHTNPGPAWFQRATAVLSGVGTVTYGYPSSGVYTFTTPGGRTWRVTNSTPFAVRRPGASSDTFTLSHPGPGLTTVTRDGVTTNYNYSVSGSTATMVVTDALSHTTTIVSDLNLRRPTSVTNANGKITTYSYDSVGQPTGVAYPEGNQVQYMLDSRGNVTETRLKAKPSSGLADIVTSAGFDASCTFTLHCNSPNWTKDANGNQTDYTYDNTTGLVTSVKAPAPSSGANRPETRYSYTTNAAGVPLLTGVSTCQTGVAPACVGSADEVKTTIGYDTALNVTSVTKGAGNGSLGATTTATYNGAGDVLTVDGPLTGSDDTTTYRYEADRLPVGVISPDPDGAGARKRRAVKVTYTTDGQPSVTEVGTVNGTSDTDWAAFISAQQVTDTYDTNARKTREVLTAGSGIYGVSEYSYDTLGRSDCVAVRMNTSAWSTPLAACTAATAGSDGPDRISRVTAYDALNRPTEVTTAYGTADASVEKQAFTDNGKTASVTDAENNVTSYTYDGFDRLWVTYYPPSAKGWGSSSLTDFEQLNYDANGNLTNRRLRDGTSITYSYDNLDRLTNKDLPGSDMDIAYGYDLLGRLTSAVGNGWQHNSFAYDALGRMVTDAKYDDYLTYAYDAAGRRTRMTWSDGFYASYDYDTTGNVTSIKENGSTVLATYGYDDLGRRTSLTRSNGVVTNYGYDAMSSLSSLTLDLAGTANDQSVSVGYNAAGQITSRTASNDTYAWTGAVNTDRNYVSNGRNQYNSAGGISFGYDGRGNLTSSGSFSYSYTSENRLALAPNSAVSYEPAGGEILQFYNYSTGTDTRFVTSGGQIVAEINASGWQMTKRYVSGASVDEPLVEYDASGNKTWLVADERGSIVARTDASGNATTINRYDEYGIPASSNQGRFQYTGQAYLPEIGLYYYKARIYSPTLGRFMQTDPIGYSDGLSWYNYAKSDPTNRTDSSGLAVCGAGDHPGTVTGSRITFCLPNGVSSADGSGGGQVSSGREATGGAVGGVLGSDSSGGIVDYQNSGEEVPSEQGDITISSSRFLTPSDIQKAAASRWGPSFGFATGLQAGRITSDGIGGYRSALRDFDQLAKWNHITPLGNLGLRDAPPKGWAIFPMPRFGIRIANVTAPGFQMRIQDAKIRIDIPMGFQIGDGFMDRSLTGEIVHYQGW